MLQTKRRPPLSEQAYNQIKDALLNGDILPGDILSENQLASSLGMSRTPIREALRALASEGWVDIRNGVGAYVKPLSSKDIEDLYEVRCLLELQAIKTSVFHITREEIDALEARFRQFLSSCQAGHPPDSRQFSLLDWELHEMIIECCQNNYLKTIMRSNISNMKRYQFLSIEALNNVQESVLQHLHILELMRRQDVPALLEALGQHLEWASSFLTLPRSSPSSNQR